MCTQCASHMCPLCLRLPRPSHVRRFAGPQGKTFGRGGGRVVHHPTRFHLWGNDNGGEHGACLPCRSTCSFCCGGKSASCLVALAAHALRDQLHTMVQKDALSASATPYDWPDARPLTCAGRRANLGARGRHGAQTAGGAHQVLANQPHQGEAATRAHRHCADYGGAACGDAHCQVGSPARDFAMVDVSPTTRHATLCVWLFNFIAMSSLRLMRAARFTVLPVTADPVDVSSRPSLRPLAFAFNTRHAGSHEGLFGQSRQSTYRLLILTGWPARDSQACCRRWRW
jgi:hypothetical protein